MTQPDYLGSANPRLVLYLPHRPNSLAEIANAPCANTLVAANSNHWRKIVNLLAKITSPVEDHWREFRDAALFRQTALCFRPELLMTDGWHWIGGKDNLQRFGALHCNTQPLTECAEVSIDIEKRLLLTPYPDYRQLSNKVVSQIRAALVSQRFYSGSPS